MYLHPIEVAIVPSPMKDDKLAKGKWSKCESRLKGFLQAILELLEHKT